MLSAPYTSSIPNKDFIKSFPLDKAPNAPPVILLIDGRWNAFVLFPSFSNLDITASKARPPNSFTVCKSFSKTSLTFSSLPPFAEDLILAVMLDHTCDIVAPSLTNILCVAVDSLCILLECLIKSTIP